MDTREAPAESQILVPAMRVEEDTHEVCRCINVKGDPNPDCFFCHGSGYRLTKRIVRRIPEPTFDEQAALAQIKTLTTDLVKAANTLEYAANLLEKAGKVKEAGQTREAVASIRASVGDQD